MRKNRYLKNFVGKYPYLAINDTLKTSTLDSANQYVIDTIIVPVIDNFNLEDRTDIIEIAQEELAPLKKNIIDFNTELKKASTNNYKT